MQAGTMYGGTHSCDCEHNGGPSSESVNSQRAVSYGAVTVVPPGLQPAVACIVHSALS